MERGVEDGHMRDLGQHLLRAAHLLERASVVERRQNRKLLYRGLDLLVDEHRPIEASAAVHDAVADCVCRDEVVHLTGFVSVDEVKLEARGAGIDDQDIHRKGFS
jgi:hypothetical protein